MTELDFSDRLFRASPDYELVRYERLPPAERRALADLRAEPDFYGVLKPKAGKSGTVKAVDSPTALLCLTLQEPGPLPGYVLQPGRAHAGTEIAQLVLDGVLEVEGHGEFLSGPKAVILLGGSRAGQAVGASRVAQLSEQALRYAAALPTDDPATIARALYTYNWVPVSPWRTLELKASAAVFGFLRIDPEGPPGWTASSAGGDGWLIWSRAAESRLQPHPVGPWHKLYVSPAVEELPETTPGVFHALAGSRCGQVKVGAGPAGLHRPDKIVAYFETFEELADGAEKVGAEIGGARAQGVPFSAEIEGEALFSWGMDPPPAAQLVSWRGPESWRAWVTNRLGLAISQCKRTEDASIPPWVFARERLRVDGVDVDCWTPDTSMWNDASAAGA